MSTAVSSPISASSRSKISLTPRTSPSQRSGYIATPQTAPLRERQPDGSRHPFDSFICAKTPAGRWLDPSELGGPAVFLASHASDAVNGHVLYVDGGILAYIGKQPK